MRIQQVQEFKIGEIAYMNRNKRIGGGTLAIGSKVVITAHRLTRHGVCVYSGRFTNFEGKQINGHESFSQDEFFTKMQAKKVLGVE